ncbi:MAG: hypothetical protein D6746_05100 [Bacteroidetes bacterium]|nr:MAG: hypothetical protein D6746_05100 [Bacteroidota bacterium]
MRYVVSVLVLIVVVLSCNPTKRIIERLREDDRMAEAVLYEALRDPRLARIVEQVTPIDTVERIIEHRDTIVLSDTVQRLLVDTVRVEAYVPYDTILFLPDSSAAVIVVVGDDGVYVDLQKYKDTKIITKRVVETKTVTKVQTVEKPVYISVPAEEKKAWPPWLVAIKWVAIALIVMSVTSFVYRLIRPSRYPL